MSKCYVMWSEMEHRYFFYNDFNEFMMYSGFKNGIQLPKGNRVYKIDIERMEIIEL